jgi:hypothetical protein
MLWKQVSTELFFFSWHLEGNELCFFASESETSDYFLFEGIHSLFWQKVEVMCAYLTII